jgi:nucleoside-diphosphate-sugar epimerase
MKVLVTGATGYIGGAVATALANAGHDVTGLARSLEARRALEEHGVSVLEGDLLDPGDLADAAGAFDGVVHAASPMDERSEQVDRNAIEIFTAALEGSEKPFIYTSGLWLHGDTGDDPAHEQSPLAPTPLIAWREPLERAMLDAAERGVRTVVIRPALVYGNAGGVPAMLVFGALERRSVQHVGDGTNRWAAVHVEDLADLYRLALESAPAGTLLIGTEDVAPTVAEVAQGAARAAGLDGAVEGWPLAQAREAIGPFADALMLDQVASGARARDLLGWRPTAAGLLADVEHGSYREALAHQGFFSSNAEPVR